MHVIRASALGLCFGVRDALKIAHGIADASDVTVHGELVHNPLDLVQLEQQGFHLLPERERDCIPATPRVLVTAHGISERERARLTDVGKQLIDTTCPLVRRAHEAAQRLARDGYYVLVIGRPGHVEGKRSGEWILMDYLDFVVHVFTPETRSYYGLERLWGDAPRLSPAATERRATRRSPSATA